MLLKTGFREAAVISTQSVNEYLFFPAIYAKKLTNCLRKRRIVSKMVWTEFQKCDEMK